MKAGELKQEFIKKWTHDISNVSRGYFIKQLDELLEQYAQQITKEKDLEIEVLNQALKKIAGI
jgi:hypothetical protein